MADSRDGLSRRRFLKGVGAVGVGAVGVGALVADSRALGGAESRAAQVPAAAAGGQVVSGPIPVTLTVNGQTRTVTVEPRTTLLNALRNHVSPPVTGPKLVCDMGTCGACTVLLDDKPVYGCLTLAVDAVGRKITTVEGLGSPEKMNPVQAAFVEKDGMMCGYCTSGFVTAISGFLKGRAHATLEEIKEGCKGNFCRCGTYPHVFEAAVVAAKANV